MPKAVFHFKQFSVRLCSDVFKLGTDACLLGAYAKSQTPPKHILDVGTGTGVIALMLAQRFPEARITGIDLNAAAVRCATANFGQSPWTDRLKTLLLDFREAETHYKAASFDWIVSNPPFFERSFPSPDPMRQLARHTDQLTETDFMKQVSHLLTESGLCQLVLPKDRLKSWQTAADSQGLHLVHQLNVRDRESRPVKRCIAVFGQQKKELEVAEWTLKKEAGYTLETIALWKAFYLRL